MASATTPDGIVYPDASDPIAPLNAVFQDLAESVQEALDTIVPGVESLPDLSDVTITSPADGQLLTYDGAVWVNEVPAVPAVPAGSVLQVVSGTKTDTQSQSLAAGASFVVTDLTASITPSSSSNKVLVTFDVSANAANQGCVVTIKRDGTAIGVGAAAGSRSRVTAGGAGLTNDRTLASFSATVLDSPASTSTLVYTVELLNPDDVTKTIFVNRSAVDADIVHGVRSASRVILMEVAG